MTKLRVVTNNTAAPQDAGTALAAYRHTVQREVEHLEAEQERLVLACREEGYSWAEIAAILDVNPQVVQKRYGPRDTAPPHEKSVRTSGTRPRITSVPIPSDKPPPKPRHRRAVRWVWWPHPARRRQGKHQSLPERGD